MSSGLDPGAGARRRRTVLPRSWQGDGRAAQWRRTRARRVVSGLLLAVAVLAVVAAVRPVSAPTREVLVAGRDLPAGHRLTAGDVRTMRWPASAKLPGAIATSAATGNVLVAEVRSGEPITRTRLRDGNRWNGIGAGKVVMAVPAPDPTTLAVLRVGDRVTLLAATGGAVLSSGVPVLALPPQQSPDATSAVTRSSSSTSGGVLVAVPAAEAPRIAAAVGAAAGGTGGVQLAISPSR